MAKQMSWPNGKKVAVSVTVMFETWTENAAPNYSVQTTHLKSGTVDHASKAWSTYGGRVGVWRLIRLLDRLQIPGTFFTSALCTTEYPDAVKQIVKSGHDIGAHSYSQDKLLAYMSPEEQQKTIRQSVDMVESCGGKKVTGCASPVIAFTPETNGFLAQAGLKWTGDVTYADLPIQIRTPYGVVAGIPEARGIVGDLGGGSVELVNVAGGQVSAAVTLPLGPLRLADYAGDDEPSLVAVPDRRHRAQHRAPPRLVASQAEQNTDTEIEAVEQHIKEDADRQYGHPEHDHELFSCGDVIGGLRKAVLVDDRHRPIGNRGGRRPN